MLVTILVVLIVTVLAVIIAASLKSNEFRVTRSASINAPVVRVFSLVNDLYEFQNWSPWAEADPEAHVTHEGPSHGVGAVTRWNGKKTGQGIMTITESYAPERVSMRLEFLKPMKCVNTVVFTFADHHDHTLVTWTMHGPNLFLGKIMSLFINTEKMCGDQFEHGLRNLKTRAESEPTE